MSSFALIFILALLPVGNLQRAADYSKKHGQKALIIQESKQLRLEVYAPGMNAQRPVHIMSITKSLIAWTALCAQADALLSLDEKVSNEIPSWKKNTLKSKITLRTLLSMTSGLASGSHYVYRQHRRDKTAAINLPALAPQNHLFQYGGAPVEVFEVFLRRRLTSRGIALENYLQKKVLRHLYTPSQLLTAPPLTWRRDGAGHLYFSAGLHLSVAQLLRFAQLLQRDGRQGLLPFFPNRPWLNLKKSTNPLPIYRVGFWFNQNATRPNSHEINPEAAIKQTHDWSWWQTASLSKHAPSDLIALVGSGGQRVYLSKKARLIIVRSGKSANFQDREFLRLLFSPN